MPRFFGVAVLDLTHENHTWPQMKPRSPRAESVPTMVLDEATGSMRGA